MTINACMTIHDRGIWDMQPRLARRLLQSGLLKSLLLQGNMIGRAHARARRPSMLGRAAGTCAGG